MPLNLDKIYTGKSDARDAMWDAHVAGEYGIPTLKVVAVAGGYQIVRTDPLTEHIIVLVHIGLEEQVNGGHGGRGCVFMTHIEDVDPRPAECTFLKTAQIGQGEWQIHTYNETLDIRRDFVVTVREAAIPEGGAVNSALREDLAMLAKEMREAES